MKKKPTNLKSNADQSSDPLMREARASVELSLKKPVKAQRHYASGGKCKQSWQPIETAPKDGTVVLCWDEFKECDLMWYGIIQQWNEPKDILGWMYVATNTECYPTHWMPLPKPPTDER